MMPIWLLFIKLHTKTGAIVHYEAFFFDFDGVLADSVEVKTRAFAKLFEPYGPEIVERVIDHHRRHGGMTRVDKFSHYYRKYLATTLDDKEMADLCRRFSELVVDEVVAAPEILGAGEFLKRWSSRLDCFVISAAPEEEIRVIVNRRGMTSYFKEILGAPADKKTNLKNLLNKYRLNPSRCCFFGDAESDYQAARACGVDFFGILPDKDAPLLRSHPGLRWTEDFRDFEKKFTPKF
jgi:beta-phosphoglucomutase-like phosphatase (HAD superfamily)